MTYMFTQHTSNDNHTMFEYFMMGYWNQMALDIYENLSDALNDFRKTEGKDRFISLSNEISALYLQGVFPEASKIGKAYSDSFWDNFSRIITNEEIESCNSIIDPVYPLDPR